MVTIDCTFKSEGKTIKKTAILNSNLTELSKSRKNEATDIIEILDYDVWAIIFDVSDTLQYEVQFMTDVNEVSRTLKPVKAITWRVSEGGIFYISDVQKVNVCFFGK